MLTALIKYNQIAFVYLDMLICNSNWGTCIASATRRPRAHHRVNPYPGARRQNETEMSSDHDKMSPSIAAVSVLCDPIVKPVTLILIQWPW